MVRRHYRRLLPGFGLSLGITVFFLTLMVVLPLAALTVTAAGLGWDGFWARVVSPPAVASYRLTVLSSLIAAGLNAVFGFIAAWTLIRYRFPGRRVIDALIDLPFAVPGAVGGIAIAAMVSRNGIVGRFLVPLGIEIAYTAAAVPFALMFAGLPFVVRAVQPVLENLDPSTEEAAGMLGANRGQTFFRVVVPAVLPALGGGVLMSFIRGLGEFGTVIFVSGNIPFRSEVTTQVIFSRIDQYDREGAAAIAVVVLLFTLLVSTVAGAIGPLRTRLLQRSAARRPHHASSTPYATVE
ncbi:MAG: sulfate ABC transporter permease subunit CysT [Spirochaetales bacterium]|nr:sulfate ABC transporter permease subunit CysT [Spirochaetales bacterium]